MNFEVTRSVVDMALAYTPPRELVIARINDLVADIQRGPTTDANCAMWAGRAHTILLWSRAHLTAHAQP